MPEMKNQVRPCEADEVTPSPQENGTPAAPPSGDYPVADFYEPVDFGWSETAYRVRQAVRAWSEQTDADY